MPNWQDDRNFTLFLQGGTFLGVHVEDVTKENMSRYGMRDVRGVGVSEIVKDSPAEKAGLRKDDVILSFNGESVTSTRKLHRLVSESSADQNVRLTISRGGSEQEVSATLSKRQGTGMLNAKIREDIKQKMELFKKDMPKIKSGDGTWVFNTGSYRRIGIATQTLTKQLADYFGVSEGILVTSVTDNSPAAKAGLKAGDVITAVDGEKVASPGDISRAIGKKQDGPVTLTVVRDRNTRSVIVTPEKPPAGSGDITNYRDSRYANHRDSADHHPGHSGDHHSDAADHRAGHSTGPGDSPGSGPDARHHLKLGRQSIQGSS